jgi:hypothetical protein
MWLMNLLPDWVFHAMLLAGVLGLIASSALKAIPFVSTYLLPIQVGALLLTIAGVWYQGAISNQAAWNARVAEMQVKVAEAEVKSANANVKIITKVVKQQQIIKERGDDIIKYVDREVIKYDTKFMPGGVCEIPKEVIQALDAAATNTPIVEKQK